MNDIGIAFLQAAQLIAAHDPELLHIVGLSLQVSFSAVVVASLLAFPAGALLAIASFRGRRPLVVISNAMLGLPSVVVGLLVYLLLSRAGPLGSYGLLFTPKAMVIAQAILVFPIVMAFTREAAEEAWREYSEQLLSLGAGRVRGAMTVLWDIRFSLFTILLAGFGRAVSEVGAVMIVGGNIDGVTRVMTTAIALETTKGDLPLALGIGVILITLVLAINAAVYLIKEAAQLRYG